MQFYLSFPHKIAWYPFYMNNFAVFLLYFKEMVTFNHFRFLPLQYYCTVKYFLHTRSRKSCSGQEKGVYEIKLRIKLYIINTGITFKEIRTSAAQLGNNRILPFD